MSSSARVRVTNLDSCSRTVAGEPTNEHDSMRATCAFSAGVQNPAMSSIGGCSRPRAPRKRFVNPCCADVKSRRASASVAATTALTPTIAYGAASCARRVETARDTVASAASSSSGAKCDANAYGNPSAAASCAPYRLEPRIHSGTSSPVPGTACTAWLGLQRPEQRLQLEHVVGERRCALGARGATRAACGSRCRARGRGRDRCGRDTAISSVPNCSATTSGE